MQLQRNSLFFLLVFAISITIISGCTKEETPVITNPPSTERGYLVSYAKTSSMTAEEVIAINRDEVDISGYTNYDLDLYSIVYNSLYGGNLVEVSGLVFIPKEVGRILDVVQHHHGTIIPGEDDAVPSTYVIGTQANSEVYLIGATMASNGYNEPMPD